MSQSASRERQRCFVCFHDFGSAGVNNPMVYVGEAQIGNGQKFGSVVVDFLAHNLRNRLREHHLHADRIKIPAHHIKRIRPRRCSGGSNGRPICQPMPITDYQYAGGAIAVAMEGGKLQWGDHQAAIALLEKVDQGDALAADVADGVVRTGKKHGVAVADAAARWGNLVREGIPYVTLLANSINHPDDRGMEIFAQALMDLFR